ncbi:hypothetical protein BYT27DRAFT_7255262 [Phlegmacium glaucopus]|nr:hypothetical protein BYT27DRAFT_7255262 [Phlegmacium glaucopus]
MAGYTYEVPGTAINQPTVNGSTAAKLTTDTVVATFEFYARPNISSPILVHISINISGHAHTGVGGQPGSSTDTTNISLPESSTDTTNAPLPESSTNVIAHGSSNNTTGTPFPESSVMSHEYSANTTTNTPFPVLLMQASAAPTVLVGDFLMVSQATPNSNTTGMFLDLEVVGQADSPANGCGMIATAPMAPAKKATKMRPGISNTARTGVRKIHGEPLLTSRNTLIISPPNVLKTYQELSASKQLIEKQKPKNSHTGGDA